MHCVPGTVRLATLCTTQAGGYAGPQGAHSAAGATTGAGGEVRHPSCQLAVSATENSGRRAGRWVFGWEGPADAACAVGMYRWGRRDSHGAVPGREAGLRFYSRNTGSHICSHQVTRLARGATGHPTVWASDLEPFSAAVHAPEDIRLPSAPAALPTHSPCLAPVKACWPKKPHTHPVLPCVASPLQPPPRLPLGW